MCFHLHVLHTQDKEHFTSGGLFYLLPSRRPLDLRPSGNLWLCLHRRGQGQLRQLLREVPPANEERRHHCHRQRKSNANVAFHLPACCITSGWPCPAVCNLCRCCGAGRSWTRPPATLIPWPSTSWTRSCTETLGSTWACWWWETVSRWPLSCREVRVDRDGLVFLGFEINSWWKWVIFLFFLQNLKQKRVLFNVKL